MLFHTHEFLILLAITAIAFTRFPSSRRGILLAASVAFYTYAGIGMGLLFAAVVAFNYFCYQRVRSGDRAGLLALAIVVDLANLFAFKYVYFALDIASSAGLPVGPAMSWVAAEVVLPVGISFYSFQMIAVLIDAHRGAAHGFRNFREFALFVSFFGQLIAGPIMRGEEFAPQLRVLRGPSREQLTEGVAYFLIGLVKKVIFADAVLAPVVDGLFAEPGSWGTGTSWLLGVLFGFQIYFDFSGYCDMAMGLGKVFGLDLRVNFATPYTSLSPSEFWARWNITLSRWFGDYVYIPLGGSRVPLPRIAINVMITMLASGLWHGAGFNFVIWGGLHGLALALFHILRKASPSVTNALSAPLDSPRTVLIASIGWLLTYIVASIGWVYFRCASVADANAVVVNMFTWRATGPEADLRYLGLLSVCLLLLHFAERWCWDRFSGFVGQAADFFARLPGPVQAMLCFPVAFAVVGVTSKIVGSFIYFQF
jgi:alginate O-acetyltransferase complex protein AlgI